MKYKSVALILFDLSIIGGIQRTTIYTAKALVEAGYDVNIVTSLINKLTFYAIHENINHIEKLKITKITLPSIFNFSPTAVSYIYKFLNLNMLMKKYLVINMHGDIQPIDAHLVYFHQFNIDYHFYSGDLIQRMRIMPLYLIRKKFIIKLRENQIPILVNSRWTFIEARKFWNLKNVHILYPPAVPDKPYMPMTWNTWNERRDDVVVTITRFSPDRGLEYVYKLAEELPWVKFIIAGYVQYKDYFLRLLSKKPKNVLLYPNITEREKYELLSKGKVYLNPTPHIEGFGIAVIEGMMMGLIPVVNNKGGVLDYVPTQYRFRNLEEAKEIIMKALKDWTPELGKEMRTVANNFSYHRYKQDLLRILNKYYNI